MPGQRPRHRARPPQQQPIAPRRGFGAHRQLSDLDRSADWKIASRSCGREFAIADILRCCAPARCDARRPRPGEQWPVRDRSQRPTPPPRRCPDCARAQRDGGAIRRAADQQRQSDRGVVGELAGKRPSACSPDPRRRTTSARTARQPRRAAASAARRLSASRPAGCSATSSPAAVAASRGNRAEDQHLAVVLRDPGRQLRAAAARSRAN